MRMGNARVGRSVLLAQRKDEPWTLHVPVVALPPKPPKTQGKPEGDAVMASRSATEEDLAKLPTVIIGLSGGIGPRQRSQGSCSSGACG